MKGSGGLINYHLYVISIICLWLLKFVNETTHEQLPCKFLQTVIGPRQGSGICWWTQTWSVTTCKSFYVYIRVKMFIGEPNHHQSPFVMLEVYVKV